MKGKEMFTEEEIEAAVNNALPGIVAKEWVSAGLIPELLKIVNSLPIEAKGEPIGFPKIQVGDLVSLEWEETSLRTKPFIIRAISDRSLEIGDGDGQLFDATDATIYLIHRPEPKLPTEAPAVIFATEVRGVKGEWWLTLDVDGGWNTHEKIDGYWGHYPESVTEWKPADFVVRDENE